MKLKGKVLLLYFIALLFYLAVPVLVMWHSWKLGLACAGLLLASHCVRELATLMMRVGK
jgi:hypothetical protein